MAYAVRRFSSLLVVAGASLGIIGALLAESVGAAREVALGIGLGLFLVGTAIGDMLARRIRGLWTPTGGAVDGASRPTPAQQPSPQGTRVRSSSTPVGPGSERSIEHR
jgi:hypothetical protein